MLRSRKPSDEHLVQRVRAGQREEYGILVERYLQTVHAVAFTRTGNHADAEDLAQETFVKGLESLDTLKNPARFGPWLVVIARNTANSFVRKQARRAKLAEFADLPEAVPADDVEQQELHDILNSKLLALDQDPREVLMLHYFAGKSLREVAILLGITKAAAQKRLWRAREALSKNFIHELGETLETKRPRATRTRKILSAVAAASLSWQPTAEAATLKTAWTTSLVLAFLAKKGVALLVLALAATAAAWWSIAPNSDEAPTQNPTAIESVASSTVERSLASRNENTSITPPAETESPAEADPTPAEDKTASDDDLSITGRIFDVDTGEGLEFMRVRVTDLDRGGGIVRNHATGPDGIYRVDGLSASRYQIETGKAVGETGMLFGPLYESKTVTLSALSNPVVLDFSFFTGTTISGQVVDAQGTPVSKAYVSVKGSAEHSKSGITQPDGTFKIYEIVPTDTAYIVAQTRELSSEIVGPFYLPEQGLEDFRITLANEMRGSIVGSVLDAHGVGVAGIRLEARLTDGPMAFPLGHRATTDEYGVFAIRSLPEGSFSLAPDGTYGIYSDVDAATNRLHPKRLTDIAVVLNQQTRVQPFLYDRGLPIAGRVTDPDGEPLTNVLIRTFRIAPYEKSRTHTDEDGSFEQGGLYEGDYRIVATHSDYSPTILKHVAAGTNNLTVILPFRTQLSGQVLDDLTEQPVTKYFISMGSAKLDINDPGGRFYFASVASGPSRWMSVESPGFVAIRRTIAIPELGEPEEDLLIYLQPGGVVEGVVRNEHYEPVPDARILVREFPDLSTISRYRLAQTTGADGTFRVDTLSALHRKLVVEHNDFARTSIDISPAPDRPTRVEITLTKGGSVEGLVTVHGLIPARSPYGFGETGSIQVDYPEQPSLAYVRSQVPADGTIGLAGLPPGEANVKITWFSEGQGNTLTQSALIEDGRPTYIDFDFQPGEASIEGTVTSSGTDTSLAPGNMVYIFVSSQPRVEAMAYGSLDSHGQYRFVNLPAGPASVEVRYSRFGQGRQFYTEDIVLEDSGEHTLDITIR